jgi:hypothetical protein
MLPPTSASATVFSPFTCGRRDFNSRERLFTNQGVQRFPGVPLVPAGFDPDPASFAPVLFMVPERLIPPVVGPLPAAPGDDPAPASFGPVLFAVPERLEPPELPSAAITGLLRARTAAMVSSAFIGVSPCCPLVGWRSPPCGNRAIARL